MKLILRDFVYSIFNILSSTPIFAEANKLEIMLFSILRESTRKMKNERL